MKTIKTEKELQQFISTINAVKSEAMTEKTDLYGSANIVGTELLEMLEKNLKGNNITTKKWYNYGGLKLTDKCFNGADIVFVYVVSYSFDYRDFRGNDYYEHIYTDYTYPVIRYKDLLLSFCEKQKGRICLGDFEANTYSDFLSKSSEDEPNLIGSMTPKKLEQWYKYICDKRDAALQKQQEAKEKVAQIVASTKTKQTYIGVPKTTLLGILNATAFATHSKSVGLGLKYVKMKLSNLVGTSISSSKLLLEPFEGKS